MTITAGRSWHLPALAGAAAILALQPAGPAAAEAIQAGVAGAVVSPVSVSGPPRSGTLDVSTGMEMFLEDRVVTGENARLQVMLLDETVFTVGPNSDLVIDRFVYDPDSGTGELVGTMTTGFLRYVSGRIGENDPESVSIETPAATIGIRGTALMVAAVPGEDGAFFCGVLGPGRDNNALARPGGCFVSNAHGQTEVLRSGYGVYVRPGEAPGAATAIPGDLAAQVHALLRPVAAELAGGAVPADVARAARGNPAGLSGQDVAAQRVLATDQFALLDEGFTLLTESSAIDELDDRPLVEPEIPPEISVTLPFFAQLTWETIPDLDLHATGPNPGGQGRYHVFFANPEGPAGANGLPVAILGEAQSSIELSEVLTFNGLPEGGVTRISVFNFTDQEIGSTSLATDANAAVALLKNGLIERGPGGSTVINGDIVDIVRPPVDGAGNTFVAFEIDPDGTVNAVGGFTDSPNSILVE